MLLSRPHKFGAIDEYYLYYVVYIYNYRPSVMVDAIVTLLCYEIF